MTLCTNCNNEIQNGEKFCPSCGRPVQAALAGISCPSCSYENPSTATFCEKCGNNLKAEPLKTEPRKKINVNTITSSGSYSGTMVSSGSKFWKRLRIAILIIVLAIAIALIIWFQVDDEAGRKLKDALMGTAFMIVFFFFGWLFFRGKKGRGRSGYDDQFDHDDDFGDSDNDD
ncbi:zinc ribbon domain-containing protein [Sunxiuqinia sp. A32]|uniref:zinc ribbon domain-containing protein n=1 Tax=Sunxiuqinia sp. A32 TaxID=3461496 RepID=UPI004045D40D